MSKGSWRRGSVTSSPSQIEFGEIELQSKLLQDAEIKSLQAQVNPHFFFNAINTVSALIRVDSEQARRLLIQLSNFFRANLQGARTNLIPLMKELTQVEAYRSLEQARFPDRYQVDISVEEGLEEVLLPAFPDPDSVGECVQACFWQPEKPTTGYGST